MSSFSTLKLGMYSERSETNAQAEILEFPSERSSSDVKLDHFIVHDGEEIAGRHLILDLWGARRIDDLDHVELALRRAVEAAGATLLHIHLHHFTPNGGVSGVAVLAESHISIHTWPERDYAALDVFMCGDARPELTIPVFEQAFEPTRLEVGEYLRGRVGSCEGGGR